MNKLLLIDGHSIINRAFYGLPDLTDSKGRHTGALYGFLTILFRLLDEEKPTHLCVAFDVSEPTFRHKIFAEYKGTRKPMPEELRQQIPFLKDMLKAMGIYTREKGGLEADDILGTFAKRAEKQGYEVALVSGDRDLLQIATKNIKIRVPKTVKGKTTIFDYYEDDVLKEYQVTPQQFIELKALMGDTADNIPGIAGVGPKTATDLMVKYGSIDGIYEHVQEIKSKSLKEKVENSRESVDLSKVLATINIDADIETDFDAAVMGNIFTPEAYELFMDYSFKNLLSKFDDNTAVSSADFSEVKDRFYRIKSKKEFDTLSEKIRNQKEIGIYLMADKEREANEEEGGQLSLFEIEKPEKRYALAISFDDGATAFIDSKITGIDPVKNLLADICGKVFIATHSVKNIYSLLDTTLADAYDAGKYFYDSQLAMYLINPLGSNPTADDVSRYALNMMLPETGIKPEKERVSELFDNKENELAQYICSYAYVTLAAKARMLETLEEQGMLKLLNEVEMPTSYVLFCMEKEGMYVKKDELSQISAEFKDAIDKLEKKIYEQAGEEFNINSPKQLGELLFVKLGLEGGKKTKTGYSTSAEVLEQLKGQCPMVEDILEYRTLVKLRSTYAEGLVQYIGEDGRIHSNFNQTITATGRLSSDNPNLQNIPTRYEQGRRLRKVFTAPEGHILVDADYSQIELRILAAFSGDPELIKAYNEDMDIHTLTASKVFHVEPEEVTSLMRRNAKAVNFGIVYGISAFGLSQDLLISREEAKTYIDEYFKTYPAIKGYLDRVKESAKSKGYSETYLGRRRPIPELKNSNFMQRQFGERVAMNAPIQGSAADVMKIAMINVFNRLLKEGLKSKLILQVHDELIIETAVDEKEKVENILKEEMEGAADFAVKLEISYSSGNNWYEAK